MATQDFPTTNPPDERLVEAAQLLGLSPKMPEIIMRDLNPSAPEDGYVAVYLEPIKYSTIGKGAKQTRMRVGSGKLVYAPRQGPEDRERFPEVYLEGEAIGLESFGGDDPCQIHEFAMEAGRFWVKAKRPLAGISIMQDDTASISLGFYLRIEDPEKHLSRCVDATTDQGLELFKESIAQFIAGYVRATFQEDIQLWSMPHIGEVANVVFTRLDDRLKEWGMRLRKSVIPERKYPQRLNELVMDFRSAEQEFLNLDQIGRDDLREQWEFESIDITEMQNISEKRGRGGGLLWIARKHKLDIEPFLQWLSAKRNPATTARDFLQEIYLEKRHPRDDIELSEQILFSAIRNPVLGLGEWADTEQEHPEKSEYRVLEGFLQAAPTTESTQPKTKSSTTSPSQAK